MTPTDEQLARDLADRNQECGHVQGDLICTRPREHEGNHRGQPIKRIIPIT
jgi:hypothetical protein